MYNADLEEASRVVEEVTHSFTSYQVLRACRPQAIRRALVWLGNQTWFVSHYEYDAQLSYAESLLRKWDLLKKIEAEEDEKPVGKAVAAARAAQRFDWHFLCFINDHVRARDNDTWRQWKKDFEVLASRRVAVSHATTHGFTLLIANEFRRRLLNGHHLPLLVTSK